jgi:hypothetical protein
MPAEAGIQSVGDNNNLKDLDSRSRLRTCRDRFRGMTAFSLYDTVSKRTGSLRMNTNWAPPSTAGIFLGTCLAQFLIRLFSSKMLPTSFHFPLAKIRTTSPAAVSITQAEFASRPAI